MERDTGNLARKQRNWQRSLAYSISEAPIEDALAPAGRLWTSKP